MQVTFPGILSSAVGGAGGLQLELEAKLVLHPYIMTHCENGHGVR